MLLLLWQCVWTWLLIYYVLFIFGLFYIMATNSPCEKVWSKGYKKYKDNSK